MATSEKKRDSTQEKWDFAIAQFSKRKYRGCAQT